MSDKEKIPDKRKWHWTAEGRIFTILGSQSVSTEVGAVFELVKNSYDADAEEVTVFFEDIEKGMGKIRIVDTGIGMTREDLEKKFRVVATSSKILESTTNSGRRVVGEKGIGRIAMQRLGKKVTIISHPKEDTMAFKTTIDWDKYEVAEVMFDTVGNDVEFFNMETSSKQGFEIIIENLRDQWTKDKILKLSKELGGLVVPMGFKTKLPFSITIDAPEFGLHGKPVKSMMLTKAMYKVIAILDGNEIIVNAYDKQQKKKIFSMELKNNRIPFENNRCGPAKYHLWGFPLGAPKEREEHVKFYGARFYSKIEEFTEKNGGIKIYRDGFRVRPYGDHGDDWLDREYFQRLRSGALPNRSLIGWVEITSDKNPGIVDTTIREKIIEDSDAFRDLKRFVQTVNERLDIYLHEKRVEKIKKQTRDIPTLLERTAKTITRTNLPDDVKNPIARDLIQYSKDVKESTEQMEKREEELMTKFEATRSLSSLGISVGIVAHEVQGELDNVFSVAKIIKEKRDQENLSKKDLDEIAIQLYSSTEYIHAYMSLVRGFTASLSSAHPTFRKKVVIDIRKELDELLTKSSKLLERLNVKPSNLIPVNLKPVHMFRADFQSMFLNLLSNSLKSIRRKRRNYNDIERRTMTHNIKISLAEDPKMTMLKINFSDDGTGVNEEIKDRIFDYFVTDYEEQDEEASGSGLGLPLIQEIAESYGGHIELVDSEFKPGATFQIQLPWKNIKA